MCAACDAGPSAIANCQQCHRADHAGSLRSDGTAQQPRSPGYIQDQLMCSACGSSPSPYFQAHGEHCPLGYQCSDQTHAKWRPTFDTFCCLPVERSCHAEGCAECIDCMPCVVPYYKSAPCDAFAGMKCSECTGCVAETSKPGCELGGCFQI